MELATPMAIGVIILVCEVCFMARFIRLYLKFLASHSLSRFGGRTRHPIAFG